MFENHGVPIWASCNLQKTLESSLTDAHVITAQEMGTRWICRVTGRTGKRERT
jgi:hypothetical protein